MARRFVRVDLSESGRDFRPVAVEPGIPVLDKAGASAKVLFRWLGGMVADVEWEGDTIGFLVRDDAGGRLEDVACVPASSEDLAGVLKPDLQQLAARLAEARAENAGERALLAALRADLDRIAQEPKLVDREYPFFRYRDAANRWRLVWCPGYQRSDAEPAGAVICSSRECALLYVRRAGQSGKCPACHAAPAPPPPSPTLVARQKRRRLLPLVLLLLILGLVCLWAWRSDIFNLRDCMEMCVGEAVALQWPDEETGAADKMPLEVVSETPAIVAVDSANRLIGTAPGTAYVNAQRGQRKRRIHVHVWEPDLQSLSIDPGEIDVAAGAEKPLVVRAKLREGREYVVAPGALRCEQRPAEKYATFDPAGPSVRGVSATPKDAPESLVLALGASKATAAVRVRGTAKQRPSPVELAIVSDQKAPVRFPVGARFDDFRVEARYPDGFTRLVTRKATLHVSDESSQSPVGIAEGKLLGLRPGKATVTAQFEGLSTARGLDAEVGAVEPDEIRIAPAAATLLPGETIHLAAVGYKTGASIGDVSQLPGVAWKSSDAAAVRADGGAITALREGTSNVTAQRGVLASKPAAIRVDASLSKSAELRVEPSMLRLRVGGIARLGGELRVTQSGVDVSRLCRVASTRPDLVRYAPQGDAIEGVAPGAATIVFSRGDQTASATVEVTPGSMPEGQLVIEPAADTISVGQAAALQAYLVTPQGERINRTAAAKWTSSSPQQVEFSGAWACGLSPGSAEVTAQTPEAKQPARAVITVDNQPITGIVVEPARIDMVPKERANLRMLGQSADGLRELFPQERLKITVGGPNPQAVAVVGSQHIDAVAPGEARVQVNWDGKFQAAALVRVGAGMWSDLAIEPSRAVLHPGQRLVYTVTGVRDGVRRLLTPADGLSLATSDASIARAEGGLAVNAVAPGRATITARVAGQEASSTLDVIAGDGAAGIVAQGRAGNHVVVGPGGTGYIVGRDGVVAPDWDSTFFTAPPAAAPPAVAAPAKSPPVVAAPRVEQLTVEPGEIRIEQGAQTPPLRVTARDSAGTSRELSAPIESMNPAVVAPDPAAPGRFRAVGVGRTQLRATAGDRSAFAEVTVTGARFAQIATKVSDQTDKDFAITADITAPASEGALEYRVYAAGQSPPQAWTPSREEGGRRRVTLVGPRLATGPPSKFYNLVFECRDAAGAVQKYPFAFRLAPVVQRAEEK